MSKILENYFNPSAIKLAYYRVSYWQDRMIKDRIGLKAFGNNLEDNCLQLSNKIVNGDYKPRKGIKFYMPKASMTQRTKTLLFIEDALIYQAIANRIGEIVLPKVRQHEHFVYGSVLSKEVGKGLAILEEKEPEYYFFKFWRNLYQQFAASIINTVEKDKVRYKFETDITGFFDSIPHYNLLSALSTDFEVEDEILDILSECLNKWSGTKERSTPGVGIPQGPAPSYLFANLLLYQLDEDLISHGHKYYRYMDDIHIYGYSKDELLNVLIQIDNYTKGHGLSINSKKTTIDRIDDTIEDETVKELKKMQFVSTFSEEELEFTISKYAKLDGAKPELEKELMVNGVHLSQQDHADSFSSIWKDATTIEDSEAIIEFWERQYKEAVNHINSLFSLQNGKVIPVRDDIKENEFLGSLFQFNAAISTLNELGKVINPDLKLLPTWLYIYKNYFWKVNMFSGLLQLYKNEPLLKYELVEMYKRGFYHYEWVRYHILTLLSFTHDFTDEELRSNFFIELKNETSVIVRIALYRLLFGKTRSPQFKSTLQIQLRKESDQYIRLTLLDFINNIEKDRENINYLLQTMGI